jgi:hypothetical protein
MGYYAIALAVSFVGGAAELPSGLGAQTVWIHIAQRPMREALSEFARQEDIGVITDSTLVEGIKSPEFAGGYTRNGAMG